MAAKQLVRAALLVSCLATAACVQTKATMLDSSTAIILARGTEFDTAGNLVKATLVKAAQLAQSRGYTYFAIKTAQDATRTSTSYTPARGFSTGSLSGNVDPYGNLDASYSGSTTWTPAHTNVYVSPGSEVMVKFYHDGEVDPQDKGVWSVASVLSVDGDTKQSATVAAPSLLPAASSAPTNATAQTGPVPAPTTQSQEQLQRYDAWQKSNGN